MFASRPCRTILAPANIGIESTCKLLWSRSHGVGSSGKDNTDLHHLRPSDCNVNSARNNLYFGACGTAAPSAKCDSPAHVEAAADTEKNPATFLPPADRRGDVARAILYMDLRYDGDEGTTTLDFIVSDCPETVPDGAGMAYLSQLLQWHLEDPPDYEEKQRNNKVCTSKLTKRRVCLLSVSVCLLCSFIWDSALPSFYLSST